MQTERIPVCNMGVFDDARSFWIDNITDLLNRFQILKEEHINLFFVYLIIEEGTGQLIINDNKIVISAPQIILIKPNCKNSFYLEKKAKGKIICFTEDFFTLRYNNNILKNFSFFKWDSPFHIKPLREEYKFITSLVTSMSKEFKNLEQSSNKILRSYLNILLVETERLSKPNNRRIIKDINSERVFELENLIRKHNHITKKPSEYADMLNISTNYLNKICKQVTGLTTGELIRKYLILEAKQLLFHTNDSVSDISDKLGFNQPSYFITLFKKETNLTPEAYRRECKMDD